MDSIRFPHLHITLEHVGQSVNIFGFSIAYYGIVIAIGVLVALFFISHEAKRLGFRQEDFMDIFLAGLICGVIGARIYYVVFSWDMYRGDLLSVLNIRQGGLAIYGGIIGGTLAVFFMTRKKKISFLAAGDIVIPGVLIGQIFGRWGNFFNREAFGGYTDSLLAMQLPVDAVRSSADVTEEMLSHVTEIDGVSYISVHPTFLYESLWNLGVFIFLFFFRYHKKWDGEIFCLYLLLYGIGRFLIEGLRTDQLMLFSTGLPVSRVLAACLVVLAAGWMALEKRKGAGNQTEKTSEKEP